MNDNELNNLDEKCKYACQSRQSFILNAIDGAVIATSDEVEILKDISAKIADYIKQIRGLATNVNQQTKHANINGNLPADEYLQIQAEQIETMRRDGENIWQLLRQLISQQNHVQQ